MRRPRGALNRGVRLQKEVPILRLGDITINNGAIGWVARTIRVLDLCCVKASAVPLADNDDADPWPVGLGVGGGIHLATSFANGG